MVDVSRQRLASVGPRVHVRPAEEDIIEQPSAGVSLRIQFRPAEERDVSSLRKLSFYQNLAELPKDDEIWVVEENGAISGAVRVGRKKVRYVLGAGKLQLFGIKKVETNSWIHGLFVHVDRRSRGLGKGLLQSVATHLRTKGIKTLYAGVSRGPSKGAARKAFLAVGFSDLGHCICARKICIGDLMTLRL